MFGNQADFLQSLGWAVLNSLWQMAALWVIYQLVTGIRRNLSAAVKSLLAASLLLTGFAWFLYTLITVYRDASATGVTIAASFITPEGSKELNSWLQQSLPLASALYLLLLVFPFLHFVRNYRYVQVIRKYGTSKINVDWKLFVNKVAERMAIRPKVKIWVSELVSSPVTVGFLKPVILVPVAAINHLTPQQLEAVLLHELAHIRRYDYLINLVLNFIQAILYFNPFVKAFVKIVEREREKSCDEMVLQFQYDSHEYASALLTLEKANHATAVLTMASGGKRSDLLNRVENIMGIQQKPVFSFNKLAALMAGLLCIITLNALIIMSKPLNNKPGAYAYITSPFEFVAGAYENHKASLPANVPAAAPTTVANTVVHERVQSPISNTIKSELRSNELPERVRVMSSSAIAVSSDPYKNLSALVRPAAVETVITPELKKYQEQQVKQALDASRKLLENAQWEALEKKYADVLTDEEKQALKNSYHVAVSKFNWQKWEDRLKLAYQKVDWDNVNNQLSVAVNQIRLDSLQRVYSNVAMKLDAMQKELSLNGLSGIPDSDVSLKEVEQKKSEVDKTLKTILGIRTKKIVHL